MQITKSSTLILKPNDSLDINVLFRVSSKYLDYEKELVDFIIIQYFDDITNKTKNDTLIVKGRVKNEKTVFFSGLLNEYDYSYLKNGFRASRTALRLNNTLDTDIYVDSIITNASNSNIKVLKGLDNYILLGGTDTMMEIVSFPYKFEFSYIDIELYYRNGNNAKVIKQRITYNPVYYENNLSIGLQCLMLSSYINKTTFTTGLGVENSSDTKYKLDSVLILNPDEDLITFEIKDSSVYEYSEERHFVDFSFTPKNIGLKEKLLKFCFSSEKGDNYKKVFLLTTLGMEEKAGVIENLSDKIRISPNPVNDVLSIKIDDQLNIDNADIEVIDIQGNLVIKTNINSTNNLINVSNLNAGMYNIVIKTNSKILTQKFVKI